MKRIDTETHQALRQAGVDWESIYARLDAVRAAVESGDIVTPQQAMAVLRARAELLAREPESPGEREDTIEVVEFVLAYETYAVESRYVREVFPLTELTHVPGMPPHVLGIINVRGRVLFVIDIKKFFGLPDKGITDLDKIVILQSPETEFGVLADRIVGTRTLVVGELQSSLPTLTGIREDYLKGVDADRTVVLDAMRLLSDDQMLAQEQVSL